MGFIMFLVYLEDIKKAFDVWFNNLILEQMNNLEQKPQSCQTDVSGMMHPDI
jgi:hypothetical protein